VRGNYGDDDGFAGKVSDLELVAVESLTTRSWLTSSLRSEAIGLQTRPRRTLRKPAESFHARPEPVMLTLVLISS
jgi:hypothetical protein